MKITSRLAYFLGFIVICGLLAFATYLQKVKGVNPCPLCIFQRFVFIALGAVFLLAAILNLKKIGNIIFSSVAYIIALVGILLAGRQVWLQHVPRSAGFDCAASLEYMMQSLPIKQVLEKVLMGTSECTLVDWQFLNLSLAEWSLICFCLFLFFSAWQFFYSFKLRAKMR